VGERRSVVLVCDLSGLDTAQAARLLAAMAAGTVFLLGVLDPRRPATELVGALRGRDGIVRVDLAAPYAGVAESRPYVDVAESRPGVDGAESRLFAGGAEPPPPEPPPPGAPRAGLARELEAALAELAAALNRDDPERLLTASHRLQQIGANLPAAEAAAAAALAWRRRGQRRRAAAANRRAAGLAAACPGARTPLLAAVGGVASLTRREWEVARLAAAGHSSKGVARALWLAESTVNSHLYRIYSKLGITRRTELGAALGRDRTADLAAAG
jgi:DNA-binding NarL/FixJ family response regulator